MISDAQRALCSSPKNTSRYQANGDRLQLENIRLGEDLDIQRLNLRDINEFLTNELKVRGGLTTKGQTRPHHRRQLRRRTCTLR